MNNAVGRIGGLLVAVTLCVCVSAGAARAETFTNTFPIGWSLTALPAPPPGGDLCAFLKQQAPDSIVYAWDNGKYRSCADGAISYVANRAYWIYFPAETTISYTGEAVPAAQEITLRPGWNLVGTSALQLVGWDDDVQVSGETLASSGRILNKLLAFKPEKGDYTLSALMNPWQGYMVFAREECTLRLPAQAARAYVSGMVADDEGRPVAGATVLATGEGRVAVTDALGQFAMPVADISAEGAPLRLSASKGGYIETFHTVRVSTDSVVNGVQSATLRLPRAPGASDATSAEIVLADGTRNTIAPAASAANGGISYTATVNITEDMAQVTFSAPGEQGAPPAVQLRLGSADGSGADPAAVLGTTGPVSGEIIYGDPTNPEDLEFFPGEFLTSSDTGNGAGGEGVLVTAGFARITLTDAAGRPIEKFAPGTAAEVTMRVPRDSVNPETGFAVKPGDTIPVFVFDENSGEWTVEHNADGSVKRTTVENDNDGNLFVKFITTHLTWFNLDWKGKLCPDGTPRVTFVDQYGALVPNVTIHPITGGWGDIPRLVPEGIATFGRAPADISWQVWGEKDGIISEVGTITACNDATLIIRAGEPECYTNAQCEEGNPYTYDRCMRPGQNNAACIHIPCTSVCSLSLQCEDDKPFTLDSCVGAGTCDSYCRHTPCTIACSVDAQCNDNKPLTSDTCGNPGTCDASCVFTPCTARCTTNTDCNDYKPLTTDTCVNGGTCQARCENIACPVACTSAANCNDGKPLTTDACINAGSCAAKCVNTPCTAACTTNANCDDGKPLTIDTCQYGGTCEASCAHKQCPVKCSSDAQCGDGKPLTRDVCENAGTCDAACTNTPCTAACTTHAQCSDGNPDTTEKCVEGGTCTAKCESYEAFCTLKLDKVNYVPGDMMIITFTASNAGPDPVLCGAEAALKRGQKPPTWNSFDENLYITIPPYSQNIIKSITKVVPNDWVGTDTNLGSDYDIYTVHSTGEWWAKGDNFNIHVKWPCTIACSANVDCIDDSPLTTDVCVNPGVCGSACTHETCPVACGSAADCPDGNPLTRDVCANPGTCTAKCENPFCTPFCTTNAQCADGNNQTRDVCENPGTCDAKCSNPTCVPRCINDAGCDDGSALTRDVCLNPDTCEAACRNETCTPACKDNDSCADTDPLTTDTCKKPDTCDAVCEHTQCQVACDNDGACADTDPLTKDVCVNAGACAAACEHNTCTPACKDDAICDDVEPLTIDKCVSPSTCDAACVNTPCPIACQSDAACNDNNVNTSDKCLNPNTCAAQCEITECVPNCETSVDCDDGEPLTSDSCLFTNNCSNSCINTPCTAACTSDENCVDTNPLTIDTCVNPGTCTAECQNMPCPIECASDTQCNDFKSTTVDVCRNPNTCGAACENCTPTCKSDTECNDGIVLTIDSCSNPNTCEAACQNVSCDPVVCKSDIDCADTNPATTDICYSPNTCASNCQHLSGVWGEVSSGSASGGGISNTFNRSSNPTIAIDNSGMPIIAWSDVTFNSNYEIYVRRWDGIGWREIGGFSASGGGISRNAAHSFYPNIATDSSGKAVVAWQNEESSTYYEVQISRWTGTLWEKIAGNSSAISIVPYVFPFLSNDPVMTFDTAGNPIVVWSFLSNNYMRIFVKKWNGNAWLEMGLGSGSGYGISGVTSGAYHPAVATDNAGNVIVAWSVNRGMNNYEIYVKRWNGSVWEEMGVGSASNGGISSNNGRSDNPSIAIDVTGTPTIAWEDNTNGNNEIFAKQFNGISWEELSAGSASGGGISKNPGSSQNPSIATNSSGRPIIVWDDDSSGKREIYASYWDGLSWSELGQGSASGDGISDNQGFSGKPSIATDSNGNVIVAWEYSSTVTGYQDIFVKKYFP